MAASSSDLNNNRRVHEGKQSSNFRIYSKGDELKKYPVLVFIHGESYEWNSGNPYDGTVLASFAGLVVVTINYRLGVLGFLNTNTDANQKSPSNYGLMDQIAALHWLQENVAYFGGDPTNVTLVGHGTGASCVNFLMSSTAVPEGLLFHRVILMSGSSLSPWALVKEPSTYARQVAQYVNCSFQLPHQILLKCLRDRPLESLLNVTVQVSEFNTAFGPNIDGVIIDIVLSDKMKIGNPDSTHITETDANAEPEYTKRPFHDIPVSEYASTILNNRATKEKLISKYSRYDMMTGVVSADSFFAFSNHDIQYGIEPDRRSKILKTFVKYTYRYHLSEILATIVNEYTEWEKPIQHPVSIRDETLEALSDAQYVGPVTQTVDLHASARKNNSYFYVFEYQSKYSYYQQRQGCVHGEELPYLFGAPLVNGLEHFSQNYTKAEISLSEAFMLYVSNFARTGNPNDPGPSQTTHQRSTPDRNRLKNVQWAPYESGPKKYLSLDTKIKLKNHYRSHKLSIWMYLIPELHKPGSDDVPPSHHQFPPDEVLYPQPSFKISNTTSMVVKSSAHNDSFNSTFDLPVVMVASSSSDRNAMTQNDDVGRDQQRMARDKAFNISLAVIITIGIGCLLISMNMVVFFVIYRKRHHTRSSSDKNSGSTRSLSSNNSLILGPEGSAQNTKKITENGGPSLNIKTNVDTRDRDLYHNIEAKTKSYMVDQSVMFVLEPLKHPDYDFDYGKHRNENDLHKSHCATLPKQPGRPVCRSNDMTPSYWPTKVEGNGAAERTEVNSRNACELGLGTIPRPPKSILKHQSVSTDIAPKCSEDYTRIRV